MQSASASHNQDLCTHLFSFLHLNWKALHPRAVVYTLVGGCCVVRLDDGRFVTTEKGRRVGGVDVEAEKKRKDQIIWICIFSGIPTF